jgi:hypothetical protein
MTKPHFKTYPNITDYCRPNKNQIRTYKNIYYHDHFIYKPLPTLYDYIKYQIELKD